MFIFIKFARIKVFLLIMSLIILCLLGINFFNQYIKSIHVLITEPSDKILEPEEIQKIFHTRNNALLKGEIDILSKLYDKELRNGSWAYEHEVKKMKYIKKWAQKQSIKFSKINSQVFVRSIQEIENGYTVNLAVSTEYEYVYNDSISLINSFRIGTYHSLDLIQNKDSWMITREWYTDPFADSLDLDEIDSKEIKEIILSDGLKELPNLSDLRLEALKYADQYCGVARPPGYNFQYNTEYRNYNPLGGDCTNFASQILFEGGEFLKNGTWDYNKNSGSKSWVNAHAFNNYMLYSGRASLISSGTYDDVLKSSYKLLPGDYIAYEKKGKVAHISIVSGIDTKGYPLVYSHNTDRYKVPWDLGWSNSEIKFLLVSVHY